MADRTQSEIISSMNNFGDSGQEDFGKDWTEFAKALLYSRGVSKKYINGEEAAYILGKIVTDMIDTGELSATSKEFIASLRINHPKSEDSEGGGGNV